MARPRALLLRGGTVYDGLGSPGVTADVLVAGGAVQRVGRLDPPAGVRVMDCDGLAVAPGFVDAHTHSDLVPLMEQPPPFKLLQGVTTEINGNCGISFAPATVESAEQLSSSLHEIVRDVRVRPGSFGEFLDAVERAGPTNHVAYLVGHSTLRLAANGAGEALRPGALERMAELAVEALRAGAVGFSTGLIYPPGSYADLAELGALARAAAPYGAVYATHMRDEGRRVLDAVDEAVAVAHAGALPLQVSHCKLAGRENHGRAGELLERLQMARLSGVDVLGDVYPYTASATALSALLPTEVMAGGAERARQRLRDPAARAALLDRARRGEPGDGIWAECRPEDVTVVSHSDPAVVGRTLADVAAGADPFDTACKLVAADPAAGVVVESMAEPDVREILASPLVGVGSDSGVPGPGPVHPRTVGTYPRLLGRYVRELGVLDLAEAVRKATSLVARRFRLHGRGTLVEGSRADVVAFDPDAVGHAGTVTKPYAPVTGVHTVLLEGEPVVVEGAFTGGRHGRVLRQRPDGAG